MRTPVRNYPPLQLSPARGKRAERSVPLYRAFSGEVDAALSNQPDRLRLRPPPHCKNTYAARCSFGRGDNLDSQIKSNAPSFSTA